MSPDRAVKGDYLKQIAFKRPVCVAVNNVISPQMLEELSLLPISFRHNTFSYLFSLRITENLNMPLSQTITIVIMEARLPPCPSRGGHVTCKVRTAAGDQLVGTLPGPERAETQTRVVRAGGSVWEMEVEVGVRGSESGAPVFGTGRTRAYPQSDYR